MSILFSFFNRPHLGLNEEYRFQIFSLRFSCQQLIQPSATTALFFCQMLDGIGAKEKTDGSKADLASSEILSGVFASFLLR